MGNYPHLTHKSMRMWFAQLSGNWIDRIKQVQRRKYGTIVNISNWNCNFVGLSHHPLASACWFFCTYRASLFSLMAKRVKYPKCANGPSGKLNPILVEFSFYILTMVPTIWPQNLRVLSSFFSTVFGMKNEVARVKTLNYRVTTTQTHRWIERQTYRLSTSITISHFSRILVSLFLI